MKNVLTALAVLAMMACTAGVFYFSNRSQQQCQDKGGHQVSQFPFGYRCEYGWPTPGPTPTPSHSNAIPGVLIP